MLIDTKFKIGDAVYLQTDNEQQKRLVTGINIRPSGLVYVLNCGTTESDHYELEISEQINVLITSTN